MKTWLATPGESSLDLLKFEGYLDGMVRAFKFNKVVSGFMEFYNKNKGTQLDRKTAARIGELLKVFAPGFYYADHQTRTGAIPV